MCSNLALDTELPIAQNEDVDLVARTLFFLHERLYVQEQRKLRILREINEINLKYPELQIPPVQQIFQDIQPSSA